jgi:glutathione S-transferase
MPLTARPPDYAMPASSVPTLRYFAARGRAQFLRYWYLLRDIELNDDEVPLSADFAAWTPIRRDRALAGPFHKLPVLDCDGQLIAETAVIAAFVHRRYGDEQQLSATENLQHAMLLSSLLGDVMTPIGLLIWLDAVYAGVDVGAAARRALDRLISQMHNIERTLVEWQWFAREGRRPVMVADCLLWEEISVLEHVFGPHLPLGTWPELARFYAEFRGRSACERELNTKPRPVTGRPNEPAAIAKLQQALAAAK